MVEKIVVRAFNNNFVRFKKTDQHMRLCVGFGQNIFDKIATTLESTDQKVYAADVTPLIALLKKELTIAPRT